MLSERIGGRQEGGNRTIAQSVESPEISSDILAKKLETLSSDITDFQNEIAFLRETGNDEYADELEMNLLPLLLQISELEKQKNLIDKTKGSRIPSIDEINLGLDQRFGFDFPSERSIARENTKKILSIIESGIPQDLLNFKTIPELNAAISALSDADIIKLSDLLSDSSISSGDEVIAMESHPLFVNGLGGDMRAFDRQDNDLVKKIVDISRALKVLPGFVFQEFERRNLFPPSQIDRNIFQVLKNEGGKDIFLNTLTRQSTQVEQDMNDLLKSGHDRDAIRLIQEHYNLINRMVSQLQKVQAETGGTTTRIQKLSQTSSARLAPEPGRLVSHLKEISQWIRDIK